MRIYTGADLHLCEFTPMWIYKPRGFTPVAEKHLREFTPTSKKHLHGFTSHTEKPLRGFTSHGKTHARFGIYTIRVCGRLLGDRKTLRSVSERKMEMSARAKQSESFYNTMKSKAKTIGMSVNVSKTQLLCVSSALHSSVNSFIKVGGKIIVGQPALKILGFPFESKPDVYVHVSA